MPPWRRPPVSTALAGGAGRMAGPAVTPASARPGYGPAAPGPAPSVGAQAWAYLIQAVAWWAAFHRHTARSLWTAGHRVAGLRQLALCVLMDVGVALVGLFVVAMIVAPILGI